MNIQLSDVIPWAIGGLGLAIAYHFITAQKDEPRLSAAGNTPDFPNFPMFGRDQHSGADMMSPPLEWPHPYAHPRIPKYVYGGGDYYSNTAPIYDPEYFMDNRLWYDRNEPPLLVKVSQNQPTPETYSHHHFYYETKPGGEPRPIDYGEFKNIV